MNGARVAAGLLLLLLWPASVSGNEAEDMPAVTVRCVQGQCMISQHDLGRIVAHIRRSAAQIAAKMVCV